MRETLHNLITIDDQLDIPKYQQIIHAIYQAIENGQLRQGDKIPSLNAIKNAFSLSRDTVLVAFKELQARGIVASTPGKGYYIQSTEIRREQKIFLLFDELNAFKEILYRSFIEGLKGRAVVDIYFHYFNKHVFYNLLEENLNKYTTFIIMPVFFRHIRPAVKKIEQGQIYMLDQFNPELGTDCPGVYQDFRKDTFEALEKGRHLIQKYEKLVMVHPGGKEPLDQARGYRDFCSKYNRTPEIIPNLDKREIRKGEAYIVARDADLVHLVKAAEANKLEIGKDLGIISYNDAPLKEVVANGITTISTDFYAMGQTLAQMVLNREKKQLKNPSSLIVRGSL